LEIFNSLVIQLIMRFDMLREMPAITARRTSTPPRMLRTRLQTAGVSLDTVVSITAQAGPNSNNVPHVTQQEAQ
jgi:hypothetical protein